MKTHKIRKATYEEIKGHLKELSDMLEETANVQETPNDVILQLKIYRRLIKAHVRLICFCIADEIRHQQKKKLPVKPPKKLAYPKTVSKPIGTGLRGRPRKENRINA